MPELPEVETIKKGLQKTIINKRISEIEVLKAKSFKGNQKAVIGNKITTVDRIAKVLILKLSSKKYLLIHLKMTGQLIYKSQGKKKKLKAKTKTKKSPYDINGLPNKYSRAIFHFSDGSKLFFNDLRIFGWIKVVAKKGLLEIKNQFGPEPFDKEFTTKYLKETFSKTSRAIKLALLDQKKIAGVGNIYANEALFEAGILPTKPADKLTELEINKLRKAIINVIKKGIKYSGSTASDDAFRTIEGQRGRMQYHFKVYARDKEKCLRCQKQITRVKMGGRGTFYCSDCQN